MITFSVEQFDNYQRNAFGTTPWVADYAGRNPVEGVNGMIKNDGSLNRASCRVFGLGAHTLAALMATVIHNLKHTRRARRARRRKNRNATTDGPPRSDTTPPVTHPPGRPHKPTPHRSSLTGTHPSNQTRPQPAVAANTTRNHPHTPANSAPNSPKTGQNPHQHP